MVITLSQSFRRPRVRPSGTHPRRALSIIATLLLLAMTAACNRVEAGKASESDTPTPPMSFEWPDDPGHPMLTLEIESGTPEANERVTGAIQIELMPELAPATVAHVMRLARDGYYDGTTFHRVIPGFMIQGGDPNSRDRDPNNDGNGNPNMRIADEFGDAPFLRGVVGMGNLGRGGTTGSQFFIMHADDHSLDGRYTVIGRVVSGIEVVDSITQVSIDRIGRWGPRDRPIENVLMNQVAIQDANQDTPTEKQRISTRTAAEDDASG
jgi:peptidyl-prolyl cis-trans isomerase B (cyclophilin B)